jgi:hypothetical protein
MLYITSKDINLSTLGFEAFDSKPGQGLRVDPFGSLRASSECAFDLALKSRDLA